MARWSVVGTASAECSDDELTECNTATNVGLGVCGISLVGNTLTVTTPSSTCPASCQSAVDNVYSMCDCDDNWEALKPGVKALVEQVGCAGASSTAPMLFVGISAVVGHFLN